MRRPRAFHLIGIAVPACRGPLRRRIAILPAVIAVAGIAYSQNDPERLTSPTVAPFAEQGRFSERPVTREQPFGTASYLGRTPGGRASLASWRAFAAQKSTFADSQTMRLGSAAINLRLDLEFAYDSNVNGSGIDPIWDLSVTPKLTLGVRWPITRQNELNMQLGLQYRKYLIHPEFDNNNFVIDPGTVLEYNVYTGDFVITVYDAPAIINDPGDDPAIYNTINFQQLDNTAGIAVLYDLNKLVSTVGFERVDIRSLSGSFSSGDRTSYVIYGGSFYGITPTTNVGVRGAVTRTDYLVDTLNDSWTTLGGVVLTSTISPHTRYYAEAGMQSATFSDNGRQEDQLTFTTEDGFNEDVTGTLGGDDYLQPYFRFSIINQLNRNYQQSLILLREAQGSSVSNYTENNLISYTGSIQLNRLARFSFLGSYEFGEISATSSPIDYWRWRSRADLALDIARDMTLIFTYDYLINDISVENGSYDRHRVAVSLSWTF